MLNAKYLAFDTPNNKKPISSGVVNAKKFGMIEQYTIKRAYRQKCFNDLIFFYSFFSPLSLHYIHFSSLSFFLRHHAFPFFSSFTLFSSQSRCFSLFLSNITLSFFFSLFSSFTPISVAVVFFFFGSDLIAGSVVGGLRW